VFLWNVLASDVESAKNVFGKVVKDGLEHEHNCNHSVLEYGMERWNFPSAVSNFKHSVKFEVRES